MKALPQDKNFLSLDEQYCGLERSKIVIVSAPYERTVSYGGGTGRAPAAIIHASRFVEFFSEITERELCFEQGIATLEPENLNGRVDHEALSVIEERTRGLLAEGKFVVVLGGEHTISAAPIRAHLERYPDMGVLQFDAHSDLRQEYEGNPYSHASVMARTIEFLDPKRLIQVGIRAQCREEFELIRAKGLRTFYAHEIRGGIYGAAWQEQIIDACPDEIYITFDVDYFDPAIMSTTGTPEPGGFFWDETVRLLYGLGKKRKIIGCDVVELAPDTANIAPTFMTAKLVYTLLSAAFTRSG